MTFEFYFENDGSLSLESAVGQAIGAGSTCWEKMDGTGIFDEARATEIVDALVGRVKEMTGSNLGLATTQELLDELRARIELDYFAGGGGLQYTTVGGRPESVLEGQEKK